MGGASCEKEELAILPLWFIGSLFLPNFNVKTQFCWAEYLCSWIREIVLKLTPTLNSIFANTV